MFKQRVRNATQWRRCGHCNGTNHVLLLFVMPQQAAQSWHRAVFGHDNTWLEAQMEGRVSGERRRLDELNGELQMLASEVVIRFSGIMYGFKNNRFYILFQNCIVLSFEAPTPQPTCPTVLTTSGLPWLTAC